MLNFKNLLLLLQNNTNKSHFIILSPGVAAQFLYLIGRKVGSLEKAEDNKGAWKEKGTYYSAFCKANGKGFNSLIFTAFQTWTHRVLLLKEQKGAEVKKKKT